MLYAWLVDSARWHDLGHISLGFTFGVLGVWPAVGWIAGTLFCDIFVDTHGVYSIKFLVDTVTKTAPALLGLWYRGRLRNV